MGVPESRPTVLPDSMTSPPPHTVPEGRGGTEIAWTEYARQIAREEANRVFDERMKASAKDRTEESLKKRVLLYGGIALGGTAIGVGTTLLVQRIRRGKKPLTGPLPLPVK